MRGGMLPCVNGSYPFLIRIPLDLTFQACALGYQSRSFIASGNLEWGLASSMSAFRSLPRALRGFASQVAGTPPPLASAAAAAAAAAAPPQDAAQHLGQLPVDNETGTSSRRESLRFDLVVVGAGPAGLSAAIRFKQASRLAAAATVAAASSPPARPPPPSLPTTSLLACSCARRGVAVT